MNISHEGKSSELCLKKNILWNSIGNLIYLVIQWLLTVVVVRISGFGNAGVFSLAMSIANILSCISHWGIRHFQVSDIRSSFCNSVYFSSRWLTSFFAFILCVIFILFSKYQPVQIGTIIFYMLFKISESLVDVLHGFDQKAFRMDIIGKSFILRGVVGFSVFTSTLLWLNNIVVSTLGMCVCSFAVILFYDIPRSKKIATFHFCFLWRDLLSLVKKCFPLMIYMISSSAIVSIPRLFLEKEWGSEILGIYASIATPAVIVQALASYMFTPFITPLSIQLSEKNKLGFIRLVTKCILVILSLSIVCLIVAQVWGDWGLKLIFGEGISQYSHYLVPVIGTTIMVAFISFMGVLLTIFRNFKGLMICSCAGLVASLLLSVILIDKYSFDGVNWTLLISLFFQIILMSVFVLKSLKDKFLNENKEGILQ